MNKLKYPKTEQEFNNLTFEELVEYCWEQLKTQNTIIKNYIIELEKIDK